MYVKLGKTVVPHPGETLSAWCKAKGMHPSELAIKLRLIKPLDDRYISGLINGTRSVTKEFAKAMADNYGFADDGQFWLNLQETFDKKVGVRDV